MQQIINMQLIGLLTKMRIPQNAVAFVEIKIQNKKVFINYFLWKKRLSNL